MRKMLTLLICMVLTSLCACGQAKPDERTTSFTVDTAEATTEQPAMTTESTTVKFEIEESDPYGNAIKKHYELLLDHGVDISTRTYYALYDIDGNGTKELLLGEDGSYKREDMITIFNVYTIQNGVAMSPEIPGGLYWSGPPTVVLDNGLIRRTEVGEGGGPFSTSYYRLEDGKLKLQKFLVDDWGEYYIRDTVDLSKKTPLTKEEFDHLKAETEDNAQVVELDWKPLAEYGK